MLRLTIEGSTVQELHDQVEQMYIHMVSDKENNCECCEHPDCPKNEILHDLPDIVKAAFAEPTETPEPESPKEHGAITRAVKEANSVMMGEPEAPKATQDELHEPTAEEVRAVLNELRKSKGAAAVKNILKAHGAENFPSLEKAHYAAVMKEAEANAAD